MSKLLRAILILGALLILLKDPTLLSSLPTKGYADLSCFGGTHVKTPRIDKIGDEGTKLTSFYVAAPLCTPSRAALMTGSHPNRIDMTGGSNFPVLLAADTKGLNPEESAMAEVTNRRVTKPGCSASDTSATRRNFCRPGRDSTNTLAFHTAMTSTRFIPNRSTKLLSICRYRTY